MIAWMLILALAGQTGAAVVTVAKGTSSDVTDVRQIVARTPAEWNALWKSHAARGAAPSVDFLGDMVAALFLGTRPTGGFSVEIVRARRDGETMIIEYTERRPDTDTLVSGPRDVIARHRLRNCPRTVQFLGSQALTSPFHIVRLPRHDGPLRFEERLGPRQ